MFLQNLSGLSLRAKLLISALALFVLTTLFVVLQLRQLFLPIAQPAVQVYEVQPGSSLSRVADELEDRNLVSSSLVFNLLARWRGVTSAIQTGEYEIDPGLTPARLLDKMVAGDQVQYRVTLVEGWTFTEALARLWQEEKLTAQLQGLEAGAVAQAMGLSQNNPEGLLFPDTYFYTKGTTDLELLQRAHGRLQTVLQDAWANRLGALPFETPYDALILASIIEKEAAAGSERGHIAGVFIRRLESGMRLQSDPTVIYGMGARYEGNITRSDLTTTTPYNTYRINGLPPTPIALAGEESIRAALNPLPSDYLYFVSRGDGTHQFSSTLEEHNAAVNRYQRQESN